MTCVEDNRIASFKLKLVKRKFCFSKKQMIGHCTKHISWMTTGNVKMVAPTESTHVCGLKKNHLKVGKKKTRKTYS